MLSHDNLTWSINAVMYKMRASGLIVSDLERQVSYLPLSHVAGLLVDVMAHYGVGHQIFFARPDAL